VGKEVSDRIASKDKENIFLKNMITYQEERQARRGLDRSSREVHCS